MWFDCPIQTPVHCPPRSWTEGTYIPTQDEHGVRGTVHISFKDRLPSWYHLNQEYDRGNEIGISAPRTAVTCLKDTELRILDALGGQMPPDEPGAMPYRTTVDEVLIRVDAVGPTSSLREMRVVTALLRAWDEQVKRAGGNAIKLGRIFEAFSHTKAN